MNNIATPKKQHACSDSVRLWDAPVHDEKYEFISINDYFSTPKWRVPEAY